MVSSESDTTAAKPPWYAGSPWSLVGFGLGLLALSPGSVLYYWFFAPVIPLVLAGIIRLFGRSPRMRAVADGALAAAVFGVAAVIIFLAGVGTVSR
jgi:hypothetical protein